MKAISALARALLAIVTVLLLAALAVGTTRLYRPVPPERGQLAGDVVAQLRFIRSALDSGAGPEMQSLFPEGDAFIHELYGLAWVNVGLQSGQDEALRQEALREARWAWEALGEAGARAPFSPSLEPPFGIFYAGWRNYLLAGILLLQPRDARDGAELARFGAECDAIARAFEANPTPFLQAYPGSSWPVDSFPAMLSLRLHGQLVDQRYEPLVSRWLTTLDAHLDPKTGLLPHRVRPDDAAILDGTRATSQSLIVRFLYELDPERGRAAYLRFREQYVTQVAGLPGVLEYPRGVRAPGDVDSGPLIYGVSLSATVVMLGTARVVGDEALADPIWHAGEVVGVPISWRGQKRYALGQLPVGDAFLAWSKSSLPWVEAEPLQLARLSPSWWRLPIHVLTALIAFPLLLLARRLLGPSSLAGG